MVTDPRASPATSAPSASSSRCPTLPPAAGRPTGRARAAPQGAPERRVGFKDERTARRPGAGDERLVRRISGPAGCAAPGRTSSEPVGGPPLLGRAGGRRLQAGFRPVLALRAGLPAPAIGASFTYAPARRWAGSGSFF